MSLTALLFGISCSNQTPNSAFIAPLQTVSANNPPWTNTPTFTFTPTPTPTPPYPVPGFNTPFALAIDSKNKIYVGDTNNNLIKQFIDGFQNTSWPSGKVKSNGLAYTSPKAITTDSLNNLYVVGNGNAISKYDTFGNFIAQYSSVLLPMSGPLGLAVTVNVSSNASTIYVSDTGNNRILSISMPGEVFNVFASSVTGPRGLAIGNGDLYVAGNDSNVHIYALPGSPVPSIPLIPGFNNPYAVALDSSNDLFVSDTSNSQIEEFTSGNYLNSPGNIIGKGTLENPEGIALDSSANVYVVDSGNSELFQFP
jgi:tripartite motif-containing protein 71